ncbi:MAG: hypothetical protein JW827_04010 [Spirochaetes bacterium]|nr:hypothetical protein [Spirochaetota bacterium]
MRSGKKMTFPSANELFLHLYDKLIKKEISTFIELSEYLEKVKVNFSVQPVLEKAFHLLQELRWGFFKDMDKYSYLKLWKELVIRNERYKEFGDLKRNIAVSNIYVAILDIHGYTRFCLESKGNLSRLHNLDEFLHTGVTEISRQNGALAKRERGDEILIVAASATDIINTTLGIINSFSRKPLFEDDVVPRVRQNYSINLPDFKISAGIAGGHYSNPLIITEDGTLSGFLLNTAARLQLRANELSPTKSKILVSQSIYKNYLNENKVTKSALFKRNLISFFYHGPVEFKNLSLLCYEIIFKSEERYRLKYEEQFDQLLKSIQAGLWKQKVFMDILEFIKKVCHIMPNFKQRINIRGKEEEIYPAFIMDMCEHAGDLYAREEDYIVAINKLADIIDRIKSIPDFDRLVLDYAREVHSKYHSIIYSYEKALESEIRKNIDIIFDEKHKMIYHNITKNMEIYDKLNTYAKRSKALGKRKAIWNTYVENRLPHIKSRIYSGDKKPHEPN